MYKLLGEIYENLTKKGTSISQPKSYKLKVFFSYKLRAKYQN